MRERERDSLISRACEILRRQTRMRLRTNGPLNVLNWYVSLKLGLLYKHAILWLKKNNEIHKDNEIDTIRMENKTFSGISRIFS